MGDNEASNAAAPGEAGNAGGDAGNAQQEYIKLKVKNEL